MDARTRYCAVYGHPIYHSASPALQNAGLAELGLNWRYLAFEVRPERLSEAITGARRMNFIGINLTVPHKVLALGMVEVLHESAQRWGAVNTIRFEAKDEKGQWLPMARFSEEIPDETRSHGFNTDAEAITRSLREDLEVEPRGASIFLLGAGGAGRVAALKLAEEGAAKLALFNRSPAKAEKLAEEIRQRYPDIEVMVGYPSGQVDLLLNATSAGLKADDPLPLDRSRFDLARVRAVYDMIYRPSETPLLAAARGAGCRVANGIGMLLYQGARALEIWSGKAAPVAVMKKALLENVYGHRGHI